MEGGGGVEVRVGSGRRRITLLDQMSAIADGRDRSGLTLDDILRSRKQAVPEPPPPPPPPPLSEPVIQSGRTLLDIIRDEDPKASSCKEFVGNRDRKSWKTFKERLRLKHNGSGAAWTSSVHVPTSDILSPRVRSQLSRRSSVRYSTESAHSLTPTDNTPSPQGFVPQISLSRRSSCRFGPSSSFAADPTQHDDAADNNNNHNSNSPPLGQVPTLRHQISRRHSTRFSPVIDESVTDPTEQPPPPMREGSRRLSAVLAEERSLSAREAVAAQEAAEAASAAAAAATDEAESAAVAPESEAGPQPVRMSLMDLLEETDRQMGFVGARYFIGDDDDDDEEYEEEEVVEDGGGGGGGGGAGGVELNCCVCMVRHKGAAFIPCGHTFCRLCSRELWVSRGNCPLCNGFILEILDIF